MDPDKIERVYTSYAGFYDRVFGKVFHEGRESAIRNLNVQPNEQILEVGVGTGLALPMYPRHCRIVGIDVSEGMLARGQRLRGESQKGVVLVLWAAAQAGDVHVFAACMASGGRIGSPCSLLFQVVENP